MDFKRCSRCRERKPISEFGVNRAKKDRLQCACTACVRRYAAKWQQLPAWRRAKKTARKVKKDKKRRETDPAFREMHLAATGEWRAKNPVKYAASQRKTHLKLKYGLTEAAFEAMKAAQGGHCALCDSDGGKKGLLVDHDHKTGAVRGLLCQGCNTGLGMLGDDVDGLRCAIEYLEGVPQKTFEPLTFVA